jgi:hypothetical protein
VVLRVWIEDMQRAQEWAETRVFSCQVRFTKVILYDYMTGIAEERFLGGNHEVCEST